MNMFSNSGCASMGYDLPAALGAAVADRDRSVICFAGDGSIMMNLQELQTVIHYKLPIKIIIFNNDGYLMIKHTQKAVLKGRYAGTDKLTGVSCPNYSKVAEAFGIASHQIRSWGDFYQVIPIVLAADHPVICEVFMHPEQPFHPKLGIAVQPDGSLISPPLEDLLPFVDRSTLAENLKVPAHPKSLKIGV
jgi:acetolactate synthase-1/2/3 large subunit